MERRKVVIDASVVVKWFAGEEFSRETGLLRNAYANGLLDVVAPSFPPHEVLNALKYSDAFGEDGQPRTRRGCYGY